MELFISIASFVLILGSIIFLRTKEKKIEIRLPDIIVSILPVFIFLIVSGKLSKFEISESGLKIETAIIDAAKSEISGLEVSMDLEKLPTVQVSSQTKGGVSNIPKLINLKTEALSFHLGYAGYLGSAIDEYLKQLSAKPYLKYLIFIDDSGKFYGIAPSAGFASLAETSPRYSQRLSLILRENNKVGLKKLVPGFLDQTTSLVQMTPRSEALSKMMDLKVDSLPVVDKDGNLAGMVDRASISSSLLLQIAANIEK